MTKYYIVWNEKRSEGFITNDETDAIASAGNRPVNMESTFGAEFRDIYLDQKRTIQSVEIHSPLSARAEKLLERIKRGDWYPAYSDRTPKAMQELIDHGLVFVTGRVKVVEKAYVANGHQRFHMDQAPDADDV